MRERAELSEKLFDKRASELIGKNVYDASASLIGSVADVGLKFDLAKGFSLIVSPQATNPGTDSRELTFEADEIAQVKDVVLLRTSHEQPQKRCPDCGNSNPAVAIYCRQCGTELSRTDYALIRGAPGKDSPTKDSPKR